MYPVVSNVQWMVMREAYGAEEATQRLQARLWADLGMTGNPTPMRPKRPGVMELARRMSSSIGQAARSIAQPNRPAPAEVS